MTTTHPDLAALLAAVCQFPADDTPRLALADWLDEQPSHIACRAPGCDGGLIHGRGACGACKGVGGFPNHYAERAEFIRVQVELDLLLVLRRKYSGTCPTCQVREGEYHRNECRLRDLCLRERELLTDARRREWSGIKCPVCDGSGTHEHTIGSQYADSRCPHCTGTGFAPVEFARGFVDRVTCRMGDVLRAVGDSESGETMAWVLTDWARGVLAAHPVTRWEIVDREPAVVTVQGERFYGWNSGDGGNVEPYRIPRCVMDEFPETAWYDTEAETRDALALAVGRVARRKWEEELTL